MRIFNNKEVKTGDNFTNTISKHKEAFDKSIKNKDQVSTLDKGSEAEKNADLVEISNEARRLHEEMERLKKNAEASKGAMEVLGKLLEIARRISNGDRVPPTDEKKLMEYSSDLYQAAKTAALLKANEKHKEHDSLFNDEDDNKEKGKGEVTVTVDSVVSNINSTIDADEMSVITNNDI